MEIQFTILIFSICFFVPSLTFNILKFDPKIKADLYVSYDFDQV